jgi:hypothetical protein
MTQQPDPCNQTSLLLQRRAESCLDLELDMNSQQRVYLVRFHEGGCGAPHCCSMVYREDDAIGHVMGRSVRL